MQAPTERIAPSSLKSTPKAATAAQGEREGGTLPTTDPQVSADLSGDWEGNSEPGTVLGTQSQWERRQTKITNLIEPA